MQHVAIMNKKLGLIDAILDGRKTIESRWLVHRSAPWNKVHTGDTIYFKDSGGLVRAKAEVDRVEQYENLTMDKVGKLVQAYGGEGKINLHNGAYESWAVGKNYCVLIWLKNPQKVEPFKVDKNGFGSAAAWMSFSGKV